MKRETRYIVLKISDVEKHLADEDKSLLAELSTKVALGRENKGKPPLDCVVVESDWPEYEPVWKMIEARIAKLGSN